MQGSTIMCFYPITTLLLLHTGTYTYTINNTAQIIIL